MIDKKKMVKTGVEVSLLGFGVMRFPQKDGKIDRELGAEMIDAAIKGGVNYFDTAYVYHGGDSEVFLGEVMKKYPRDSYYLATKLPLWSAKTADAAEKIFAEHLSRLQTDYVDFYLMHNFAGEDTFKMIQDYGLDFINKKKAEGKIKYAGFSFHDVPDVLEKRLDMYDWDFVQVQVNYLDWDVQRAKETCEILDKRGVSLIVMEPVRGGRLVNPGPEAVAALKSVNPKATTASMALRWVGSCTKADVILSGMSNMEQVLENIDIFTDFKPLSEAELKAVNKAADIIKSVDIVPCTDCKYCMPCPVGVNIPENLEIYNTFIKGGGNTLLKWDYERLFKDGGGARDCISCGVCCEKCPQKIDIPAKLAEMVKKMDEQ